jgi:hypothetical protein
MRRFIVLLVLLCALAIGVSYAYTRGGTERTFITAPVERGTIGARE